MANNTIRNSKMYLTILLICRQCFSFEMNDKIAEEVQDLINSITPCHVHLIHDDLNLPGPISNPSVTIWRLNKTDKLYKTKRCRFRRLDVTQVKGIHCVYAVIFLANQTKLSKPTNNKRRRNGVVSFSFYSVQNCFWHDYSIPIPNTKSPSRRLPSSSSYIVFFTPLQTFQWIQMLHSDKDVLASCPKTGLRLFNTSSSTSLQAKKTEGYFQCSFCTESTPLLVPMKEEDQSNIVRFKDFSRRMQYKLWKVSDEINSVAHDFFTNEENNKLLFETREFDIPRLLLHGLIKDPTSAKLSLDLMVLHKLADTLNATILLCRYSQSANTFCDRPSLDQSMHRSIIYTSNNKKLAFTDNEDIDALTETLRSSSVVLRIEGFKFLTCYHVPLISFRFYVDPFQPDLWITFAFTSFVIAVLLHIFVLKYHKSQSGRFHPYFFMLSTITDDSCGMPTTLATQTVIRISLGPWFLMTVVLVNAYLGLVITGLTSPFPLESVKSFRELTKMHFSPKEIARGLIWSRNYLEDLPVFVQAEKDNFFDIPKTREFNPELDFQIYSSLNEMDIPRFHATSQQYTEFISAKESVERSFKAFQAFGKFVGDFSNKKSKLEYFFSAFIDEVSLSVDLRRELIAKNNPIHSFEDSIILNLYVPSHVFVPPSYSNGNWNYPFASAVEVELVKCGRSAYADLKSVVEMEHKYLSDRYSWIEFFISEDEIGKEMDSWLFPGMHDGAPLVRAMKAFVYSGIYRKLEEYFMKEGFVERKEYTVNSDRFKGKTTEGPTAISLTGSIQTAFFIFASAVTICLLALLFETILFHRNQFRSLIAIIIVSIRSLMREGTNYWLLLINGRRFWN
jgi:hypothetical protein